MIDLKLFREDPERLRAACRQKRATVDVDRGVALDARRRAIIQEQEALQSERNTASKEIGRAKKAGEDAAAAMERMREVGERIKALAAERAAVEEELHALALSIPNHPGAGVPEGAGEADNAVVQEAGPLPAFDFEPKPHWDLAETLGLVDFERGARMAGSGFILYKGLGARLERALIQFFLDLHTSKHGYLEWFPPFLANRRSMTGTGQLPKMEEDMYGTDKGEDLFLIPTAEVPITNIHQDDILDEASLPLYYTAYSACFRREAGAAGKDTRGLLRVHQFNKVELVKFVTPETSYNELESLRGNAEAALRALGLTYRVLELCAGDLSFAAAKCYDFEVWAPGVSRWLEVSSCSNFEDFQARRANIRSRPADGKPRFVHTLNGSGLALPRTVVALLETYQRADGTVALPEVLHPYMGGIEILEPA